MTPEILEVGKTYNGTLLETDSAVFEFSKSGPELRLFFAEPPDGLVRTVAEEEVRIGVLQVEDIAVVPWQIGDRMTGDAQFHVFLYPPETRPVPEVLSQDSRYTLYLSLIDRSSGLIKVVRRLWLSTAMSDRLNEIIAYQHGNHIGREEYDAQVSIYQNRYADVTQAIRDATIFEPLQPVHGSS
ncbi:hypothetical protein [Noviherbaspirillum aerium]|uniref:hypothetical protein n=1 Tax=Noviherbaspirillum aerium TaxID=2588497 RepID=UPI00124E3490|nr:hypothetical protein [Noviherbaspirillum aerium]